MLHNVKKPEELFKGWKVSLKSPDDSIFYYYTELERVLLSLAISQSDEFITKPAPTHVVTSYSNEYGE